MHRLGGVKECITADGRKAPVGDLPAFSFMPRVVVG